MSESVVSRRYANALFQLGKERNKLEQFEEELRNIRAVWVTNKELLTFLKHPRVSIDKKKQTIATGFAGYSSEVLNTLMLLLDRHREDIIPDLIDHFIEKVNDAKGIAEAKVYSVRELSEDEKLQISNVFAKKIGKNTLKITNIIDRSILGGIKIRIGNRIYDGSISGKLERIERKLVSGNNR
ncbi:ATP synthase subunit delta [Thalassobacillus devorans]|uniref:ATP synthase subunit delta n=1 Tax=Thalassobacillus devorans TaxID=279813 RepID=A0ABQ1NW02_9BACI|nr:F0F1 ATP synthase subunit delta [Thalassobacillus devorans]NIK28468.1 F-type H+-transporting ATPase subunit delta [Thalassobacillus devorans]GGC85960.1 ATP synthase subunit delta [Thalassobacillus devorans]